MGSKYTVHKAVRKYGDRVIVTVLSAGSIQDSRDTELRMRPKPNMGWNFAAGGGGNPGLVHTQEARKKMSEANRAWLSIPNNKKCIPHTAAAKVRMSVAKAGKAPSEATKIAQKLCMSVLHSWEKPASNASVWLLADDFYDFCCEANWEVSDRKLSAQFGLGRSEVRAVLKKINGGWNPHIDAAWNNFHDSNN
jgi:hypothetical protein